MKWMICIPAWGERCLGAFERCALPATLQAIELAGIDATVLVHTDDQFRVAKYMQGCRGAKFIVRGLPTDRVGHYQLGDCHRASLDEAKGFDVLAFINADMVPSIELFAAAQRRIEDGKKLIMMAGTRTHGEDPPVGAASRDLLRWAIEHPHPSTIDAVFGQGHSRMCSTVYFQRGPDVVLHAFHLHPFAIVLDRNVGFTGVTIDCDLADQFAETEIHVVTDAEEAAFAETSPLDRTFETGDTPMNIDAILAWVRQSNAVTLRHRWFFEQPITVCGEGVDIGNRAIAGCVLRELRETR